MLDKHIFLAFFLLLVSITAQIDYEYQIGGDSELSTYVEESSDGQLKILCSFNKNPENVGELKFEWLRNNGSLVSTFPSTVVPKEDLVKNGPYVCKVSDQQGKSRKAGLVYNSLVKPVQTSYSFNVKETRINNGEGSELEAIFSPTLPADAKIVFTWTKDGKVLGYDRIYRVPKIDKTLSGEYHCKALVRTGNNEHTYNAISILTVEQKNENLGTDDKAMQPYPGHIFNVDYKSDIEIHCDHNTPENPTVKWTFNGQPLDDRMIAASNGNLKMLNIGSASILNIEKATDKEKGNYQCTFEKDGKQEIRLAELKVISTQELSIAPKHSILDKGKPIEFHCSVNGPGPSIGADIKWYFKAPGSSTRTPIDQKYIKTSTQTSFFSKKMDEGDDGEYICEIISDGKIETQTATVEKSDNFTWTHSGDDTKVPVVTMSKKSISVPNGGDYKVVCKIENYPTDFSILDVVVKANPKVKFTKNEIGTDEIEISGKGIKDTEFTCIYEDVEDKSTLTVTDCAEPNRRCENGKCIHGGKFCDKIDDCGDNSDEQQCEACDPLMRKCEDYEGNSPKQQFYNLNWQCDGENDCGNRYDEADCQNICSGTRNTTHFKCGAEEKYIPKAFVCDEENDCPNNEDESDCSAPEILTKVEESYEAKVGSTVTLECKASGKPIPIVAWRFNWKCMAGQNHGDSQIPYLESPGLDRFKIETKIDDCDVARPVVTSTLTIQGVKVTDQGYYNCEAVSGKHRIMSENFDFKVPMN